MRFNLVILSLLSLCSLLQGCIALAAGGTATGVSVVTDRRTAGTILDDQTIEVKALNALSKHKALWKASHFNVISYNNVLLVLGQTPTEDKKREAEHALGNIPKVRRIHNELTVEPNTSLATRTKDSWITTQIKTKLLGTKKVSATHIKVITENSIVYLMGIVTPEEASIATDIAREVEGVEKVIQIFEELH